MNIKSVNGRSTEYIRDRVPFDFLTPLFPDQKFNLLGNGHMSDVSCRIVDMFSPIGKGQRMLIVSPPKAGKTLLLKSIANAIADNHPEVYEIVLLVDERPEEVTDMQRSVKAEVVASTFDEPAEKHVKVANMVIERPAGWWSAATTWLSCLIPSPGSPAPTTPCSPPRERC